MNLVSASLLMNALYVVSKSVTLNCTNSVWKFSRCLMDFCTLNLYE
jgi:hypothetical protein